MSSTNHIITFLLNNPTPCERSLCTTCGGRLPFFIRFREAFPNDDDLLESLKNLKGSEIAHIRTDQCSMPHILNIISDDTRKRILDTWMTNIMNDQNLALAVLLLTEFGKSLPQNMINNILIAAESQLILSRTLRDNLRKVLNTETEIPPRLKSSIEKDIQEDDENYRQACIAAKNRTDYLDRLSSISFGERVPRILSDQSIKYTDWREAWSVCSDEDIVKLNATDVQTLIDLCEGNQSYRWTEALRKLYDRRHQLRYVEIERFKQQYSQMTPHDQLLLLISNRSVPIENYPVDLAQYVTLQWIESLSDSDKSHLFDLLNHTRLRTWKKVREKCIT